MRRTARFVKFINYVCHRTLLPAEAIVGDNVILEHYALGVVMHPNVVIGDDCRIYHHVTIAGESEIGGPYRVSVGDRVTIGANAVILPRSNTPLSIGDDAIVGAGSVVTCDVPAGAIVVGVPAKVIRYRAEVSEVEAGQSDRNVRQAKRASEVHLTRPPVKANTVEIDSPTGVEQSMGILNR